MHSSATPFHYAQYRLHVESVSLERIAKKVGTPFYVYSADFVTARLREFQTALSELNPLTCFSVKSNPCGAILRLVADAGEGADVVSGPEAWRARRAGIAASKIVYSGVGKTRDEIDEALRAGILSFNIESLEELELIRQRARSLRRKAGVAIRLNPGIAAGGHAHLKVGAATSKFGLAIAPALEAARLAARVPELELRGVSIHVGSQIMSLQPLELAFRQAEAFCEHCARLVGHPLKFLDLGGGLGIDYEQKKRRAPNIPQYCKALKKIIGSTRPADRSWSRLVLEPGRSIVGNAGALVTEVLYRKPSDGRSFLVVDAGMNDLIRPAFYDSFHEILPVRRRAGRASRVEIVGPVCESADRFASGRRLPGPAVPGDLLAILSAGAYGFAMSSNYNSRLRPAEVLVRGRHFDCVRRRETPADLVRNEVVRGTSGT